MKNILQAVPTMEERFKEKEKEAGIFLDSDGSMSPKSKNRRISGWNFNEDIFQLDPVYPLYEEKNTHNTCVEDKPKQDDDTKFEGVDKEPPLQPKACKPPTPLVVSKESLVPNLVLLLSSLDMQRAMVMNTLAHCQGEVYSCNEEAIREHREQCLVGLVRRLQQTVDELYHQLEKEMKRNTYLEETLESLRQNKIGH